MEIKVRITQEGFDITLIKKDGTEVSRGMIADATGAVSKQEGSWFDDVEDELADALEWLADGYFVVMTCLNKY